ncbi:hypothetical protein N431DRAFT_519634 [Stipitochalara longipes BDJ]|nr:hypothetical protein N431DRAFT_519634 [Stipitochalara longipes BDJ]
MEQNYPTTFTPMHLDVPLPYNIKQDPSTECTVYSVPFTNSSLSEDETTPFKFKPIVIPPHLQNVDINESEFLFFLDGLNEAFVAAPPFQVASNVGTVMSFAPLPSIRYTGMGLALGAGLVSSATSNDDPRIRRVLALGDRVAALKFEGLPPPEPFENWLKRWGSKSAHNQDAKMQKKLLKKRMKLVEEYQKKMEEVEMELRKGDHEVAKIERQRNLEVAKVDKKLEQRGSDPKKRAKIEGALSAELEKLDESMDKALWKKEERVAKKTEKSERKLEKVDKREHKIAQKIYWIVIDKTENFEKDSEPEDGEEAG